MRCWWLIACGIDILIGFIFQQYCVSQISEFDSDTCKQMVRREYISRLECVCVPAYNLTKCVQPIYILAVSQRTL